MIEKEKIMKHTKTFATKEEFEDLRRLANAGWRCGDVCIVTSIMQGITKDQKTIDALKTCHKVALSHGLPEIKGYYGITEDGEFINF